MKAGFLFFDRNAGRQALDQVRERAVPRRRPRLIRRWRAQPKPPLSRSRRKPDRRPRGRLAARRAER